MIITPDSFKKSLDNRFCTCTANIRHRHHHHHPIMTYYVIGLWFKSKTIYQVLPCDQHSICLSIYQLAFSSHIIIFIRCKISLTDFEIGYLSFLIIQINLKKLIPAETYQQMANELLYIVANGSTHYIAILTGRSLIELWIKCWWMNSEKILGFYFL